MTGPGAPGIDHRGGPCDSQGSGTRIATRWLPRSLSDGRGGRRLPVVSSTGERSEIRLSELVALLSLGTDLGLGQPMEHMINACLIALRLAERLGMDDSERPVLYYSGLLAWVGCHSDAYEQAKWFGDDLSSKSDAHYAVDWGRVGPATSFMDLREQTRGIQRFVFVAVRRTGRTDRPSVSSFLPVCSINVTLASATSRTGEGGPRGR